MLTGLVAVNIQLSGAEEFINQKSTGSLGEVLIR